MNNQATSSSRQSAVSTETIGRQGLSHRAAGTAIRQFPLITLVALFLAPGAAGALAYIALAGAIQAAGYPPIAALLVAITVMILPIELGILLLAQSQTKAAGEPLIPYRERMAVSAWVWLVPVLLLAALVGSGILMFADTALARGIFSWLPGWYLRPVDYQLVGRYSTTAWIVILPAYMVLNGFAGPIVEELYFRGFLLPRMERFGRWAPVINAALFSLYHFWAPWQFLSRLAAVAPFVGAVRWRRNIYLGMTVHILLNTIGGGLVVANIVGRL
jgi:membrane protease YdiL (CAAX protease family)